MLFSFQREEGTGDDTMSEQEAEPMDIAPPMKPMDLLSLTKPVDDTEPTKCMDDSQSSEVNEEPSPSLESGSVEKSEKPGLGMRTKQRKNSLLGRLVETCAKKLHGEIASDDEVNMVFGLKIEWEIEELSLLDMTLLF